MINWVFSTCFEKNGLNWNLVNHKPSLESIKSCIEKLYFILIYITSIPTSEATFMSAHELQDTLLLGVGLEMDVVVVMVGVQLLHFNEGYLRNVDSVLRSV
jgi:hypothetical protein